MTLKERLEYAERKIDLACKEYGTPSVGYWRGYRAALCESFLIEPESPRPDWTPCAEGSMPEDDANFCAWMQLEATIELNGRYSTRTVSRFYVPLVGTWVWADGWTSYPTETGITADKADIGKVVAWRYPEPYNPDRKEDADRIVDGNKKVDQDDVSQWPDWKKRAALGNYEIGKED